MLPVYTPALPSTDLHEVNQIRDRLLILDDRSFSLLGGWWSDVVSENDVAVVCSRGTAKLGGEGGTREWHPVECKRK